MDEYGKYKLSLLEHTLGGKTEKQWYRNHFVASKGHHDYRALEALADDGLMVQVESPCLLDSNAITYRVTDAGKQHILEFGLDTDTDTDTEGGGE